MLNNCAYCFKYYHRRKCSFDNERQYHSKYNLRFKRILRCGFNMCQCVMYSCYQANYDSNVDICCHMLSPTVAYHRLNMIRPIIVITIPTWSLNCTNNTANTPIENIRKILYFVNIPMAIRKNANNAIISNISADSVGATRNIFIVIPPKMATLLLLSQVTYRPLLMLRQ